MKHLDLFEKQYMVNVNGGAIALGQGIATAIECV